MTKDDIKAVLERVRAWPADRQADLARIALLIEAQDATLEPEDAATQMAIAEGLAQARRDEFATDKEVKAAYARFRA